jgi:hypothetical protein
MGKKVLSFLLKIAISVGLMYLVLRRVAPDWGVCAEQMMGALREGYGWLVGAMLVSGIAFGISAWRWKVILDAHEVGLRYVETLRLFMVAVFFSQFMPGGLATGDVVRSYYVASRTSEKKTEAVATVVVDRVVGLFGIATVIAISLLAGAGEYVRRCLILIGIAVVGAIGVILFFHKRVLKRLPFAGWIYEHLPYRESLLRVYEAFRHYGEHKLVLVVCWVQSAVIQLLLVLAAFCVGHAVGVQATGRQYLVRMPLVGALSSLPISVGTIGTAEAGYALLFLAGSDPEGYRSTVLAFALMMRVLWLFLGAVGGLVWWVEKGKIQRKVCEEGEEAREDIP